MVESDGSMTSTSLLNRVRDRRDHPAWVAFFERYDPMLRRWCRQYGLDDDASDELCQRTWNRLWPLMQTFQYDPSRRFRGWLWRSFRSRAMDMLAESKATRFVPLEVLSRAESPFFTDGREVDRLERGDPEDEQQPDRLVLLREAEEAQGVVRACFDPETWRAFWMTKIEDRPVREVAEALGKSYAAVYYGSLRVERRLRNEGERRLSKLLQQTHGAGETDRIDSDPSTVP